MVAHAQAQLNALISLAYTEEKNLQDSENEPITYADWYDLKRWPWAFLEDAQALLDAIQKRDEAYSTPENGRARFEERRLWATARVDLDTYHFVMTMGTLIKTLNRVAPLFPSIQILFEKAEHLKAEGTYLRNMIEHADKNVAAQNRGTPRGGFVRKSNLLPELPGSRPGTVDAISLIGDQDGHWLGGRLNVERTVVDVRPIHQAAQKIPQPIDPNIPPSPQPVYPPP
jgi:hypothetical protein